ncbi:L-lactate permease [Lysinibacillus sp. 54212]|uniref:L-lactate permease n=1 Tax=Lysinibacillus sp. 54212 TaxID=3119829 RepID=UPI002FC704AF
MSFFLSCIPILVIMICIFILKKSSIFSGVVALFVTLSLMILPSFNHTTINLSHPFIKSSLTTLSIAYILVFGIFLFQLMEQAGAIQGLANAIKSATPDRFYQILLLILCFSPLIESISGFGLAVIIIAPILIALGIAPIKAALLALISLCIIPWGTLSMGSIIGASLAHIELSALGQWSAVLSIPLFVFIAFLSIGIGLDWSAARMRWKEIVYFGLILGVAILGCNRWISVELAGVFGSIIMMGAIFIRIRKQANLNYRALFYFLTPYILLIILLFFSRTIPFVQQTLLQLGTWNIKAFQFSLSFLYSPGFFLIIVSLFTILLYKLNLKQIRASAVRTWQQCLPILFSTFLFISVAELMSLNSMITILAGTIASLMGPAFLYFSPIIGATGGFLTGSNTASNSMLIRLQTETAHLVGISSVEVAASQNVSSSFSTMMNPAKVALSCSICNEKNKESMIQREILKVGIGTVLIIMLVLGFIQIFSEFNSF